MSIDSATKPLSFLDHFVLLSPQSQTAVSELVFDLLHHERSSASHQERECAIPESASAPTVHRGAECRHLALVYSAPNDPLRLPPGPDHV